MTTEPETKTRVTYHVQARFIAIEPREQFWVTCSTDDTVPPAMRYIERARKDFTTHEFRLIKRTITETDEVIDA